MTISFHTPFPWKNEGFPQPGQLHRLGRLLLREKGYADLWRSTKSIEVLEHAGFFDDGLSRKEALDLLGDASLHTWTTPLPDHQTLKAAMESEKPIVVLLATGSFAPFHDGHRAMIEASEKVAIDAGLHVLASYVSPSHDGYVAGKDGASCSLYPAALRVDLARKSLSEAPGKSLRFVDPWEALIASRPVNFTTVATRLQKYLQHHLGLNIRVMYVFGADNASFAKAFEDDNDQPSTICVGRPGYGLPPYGLFAPLSNDQSSTKIRRSVSSDNAVPHKDGVYLMRDEGLWAISHWQKMMPDFDMLPAWNHFKVSVMRIIGKAFTDALVVPDRFQEVSLQRQREQVVNITKNGQCVIVLDPCVEDMPGVTPWPRSRRFKIADTQKSSHSRGQRANSSDPPDLPEKAWLVDDDVSTGQSLLSAERELQELGVNILGHHLLADINENVFDIVDLRDFLPGSREGGLTVEHPSGILFRVPYMAPQVDLRTRACIPAGQAWRVSADLWGAAADFFKALPVALTVSTMWPSSRSAFVKQGFDEATPISDVCIHMLKLCSVEHCANPIAHDKMGHEQISKQKRKPLSR